MIILITKIKIMARRAQKIFVQIASYRDPELVPTIEDMLNERENVPKTVVFGICRQYHSEDGFDNLDKYRDDERFRILDIPYEDSKGACWARHSNSTTI